MKTWDLVSLINLPSLFSNGNKNVKGLQTSVFVLIYKSVTKKVYLISKQVPNKHGN